MRYRYDVMTGIVTDEDGREVAEFHSVDEVIDAYQGEVEIF
jgi:hypothetical protein